MEAMVRPSLTSTRPRWPLMVTAPARRSRPRPPGPGQSRGRIGCGCAALGQGDAAAADGEGGTLDIQILLRAQGEGRSAVLQRRGDGLLRLLADLGVARSMQTLKTILAF